MSNDSRRSKSKERKASGDSKKRILGGRLKAAMAAPVGEITVVSPSGDEVTVDVDDLDVDVIVEAFGLSFRPSTLCSQSADGKRKVIPIKSRKKFVPGQRYYVQQPGGGGGDVSTVAVAPRQHGLLGLRPQQHPQQQQLVVDGRQQQLQQPSVVRRAVGEGQERISAQTELYL